MVIKKHLCCQKIQTAVHLFLQITDVFLLSIALHMSFRIAGAANAEIPAFFQKLDESCRMLELIFRRVCHPFRNVAPKRQYILNPFLL